MRHPSRTATVVTNLRCNHNCSYCNSRSAADDLASIAAPRVRERIDAALASGARELLFTGGEPTLRADLEQLIAHARTAGAERVGLETNAVLVDDARARALAAAGLELARVNLAGIDARLDGVTRDDGGFERTLAGLRALHRAGVTIEILTVLVRSTLPWIAELPERLVSWLGPNGVRAVEVAIPTDAPDPAELISYEEAAQTLIALEAAARALGLAVRMSPGAGVPPCVFPARARMTHLYTLTPEVPRLPRHTQLAPCGECLIADRCSGFADQYLARRPPPPMHPVREDRVRRRLSLLSTVPEQIAHELVSRSLFADAAGRAGYDEIVRVNFHCNQSCTFCFVSTHLPPASDDAVEEAIRAAGRRGSRIVLSGGEPTLNPRLVHYVRLAKSVTTLAVSLQTNAIRLDDAALTDALAAAGLDEAFVSLHGATAEISDAVTEAPGTFVRTVAGLDNLARTRVRITLNFVICEANRRELPHFVRFVAARWPEALVNISFVAASTDVVPRDRRLIPRYSDALPPLAEALDEARRLGVHLLGFESMCGLPLCLVPPSLHDTLALAEIPAGFDRGEFLKAEACRGCRYETTCFGLRRGYAELYGTDELRTVAGER
ncbi:MAG TPA: radical SAM protein [Polyangia bacterium]|nr:radical SAM protein [Polyangia bacterium]